MAKYDPVRQEWTAELGPDEPVDEPAVAVDNAQVKAPVKKTAPKKAR